MCSREFSSGVCIRWEMSQSTSRAFGHSPTVVLVRASRRLSLVLGTGFRLSLTPRQGELDSRRLVVVSRMGMRSPSRVSSSATFCPPAIAAPNPLLPPQPTPHAWLSCTPPAACPLSGVLLRAFCVPRGDARLSCTRCRGDVSSTSCTKNEKGLRNRFQFVS